MPDKLIEPNGDVPEEGRITINYTSPAFVEAHGNGGYKFGGHLSHAKRGPSYAVCDTCEIIYTDDVPMHGSVICPSCNSLALRRGVTEGEVENLTITTSDA